MVSRIEDHSAKMAVLAEDSKDTESEPGSANSTPSKASSKSEEYNSPMSVTTTMAVDPAMAVDSPMAVDNGADEVIELSEGEDANYVPREEKKKIIWPAGTRCAWPNCPIDEPHEDMRKCFNCGAGMHHFCAIANGDERHNCCCAACQTCNEDNQARSPEPNISSPPPPPPCVNAGSHE